jgi:hypothetical protein
MILKSVFDLATSKHELEIFLEKNIHELYDLYNSDYSTLLEHKDAINSFVLTKRVGVYGSLDYNKSSNKAFIIILLDLCVRLGFSFSAIQIVNVIEGKNISIGSRLDAAIAFLLAPNNKELVGRFDYICEKLQISLMEEEDSIERVLTTFGNYFAKVVRDTSPKFVDILGGKIKDLQQTSDNHFIKHEFINTLLKINSYNQEESYLIIQSAIEKISGRRNLKMIVNRLTEVEQYTNYVKNFIDNPIKFEFIWQIAAESMSLFSFEEKANIHSRISRGVKVLDDELELFGYIYFYGKMHYAKILDAVKYLPDQLFGKKIELVDWGCGQGLGIIGLFDYLRLNNKLTEFESVTLIEPSEYCLKRAAFHLRKYDSNVSLNTIKSDFDSIFSVDLGFKKELIKLHIFSNILDVEFFNFSRLLSFVSKNCQGLNYFICVSPFINDIKTARINAFMNYFSRNNNFEILQSIDSKKGDWVNGWTRILRVFKTDI